MRRLPYSILIALTSILFGGYLSYIAQYEAGAAMFGVAVAALGFDNNNDDDKQLLPSKAFLELKLEHKDKLHRLELEHRDKLIEKDKQLFIVEAKLGMTEGVSKALPLSE